MLFTIYSFTIESFTPNSYREYNLTLLSVKQVQLRITINAKENIQF